MSLIVVESGASSFPPLMHYGARRGRGRGDYSSLVPRRYFIIGGCILTTRLVQAESVCKRSSHWTHQCGSFCETRSAVLDHAGAMNAFGDWHVGNIMTLGGSETSTDFLDFFEEVRLVDYAETQELDSHFREQDCTRAFPICPSTV